MVTGRRGRPRLPPDVLAVVFVGGCLGGWVRYAVTEAWHSPERGFPLATLAVNVVGAFVLGAVVVAAAELPSRYVRPLVGTGFCGALTTFSAVVVAVDRLIAHDRIGTAIGYLCATILGGLLTGYLGLVAGRTLTRQTVTGRRSPDEGSA